MDNTHNAGELSESQRAGLEVRQADQDRTLSAMHRLEAMLAAAAPGREQEWRSEGRSSPSTTPNGQQTIGARVKRPVAG